MGRFGDCKPRNGTKRSLTQIKQRYYECMRATGKFVGKYNEKSEDLRRQSLEKLLQRTHDCNASIAQSAEYFRKHDKSLRNRLHAMQCKQRQLAKQSAFICQRRRQKQQSNEQEIEIDDALPFAIGSCHGFGCTMTDTMRHPNVQSNTDNICLRKMAKIKQKIQMIDDEETRYRYELKLDGQTTKIIHIPMPFVNDEKNKKMQKMFEQMSEDELLCSANPNVGQYVAWLTETKLPKLNPVTSATRAMLNVLRRDFIKYYAMRIKVNDLKIKNKQK